MELDMENNTNINNKKKRLGGLRTMPFIFANEVAEKLAVVGFAANMITYLTQQLHIPLAKSATTLTNFSGTASLTPLLGAFIADAYIGRFWTITIASVLYQIGMISLTISAVLPHFRPPPCGGNQVCQEATSWQLGVLYISLLLTALGAGGIRPCVVAFGADQFDESNPKEKTRTWNFFNWYYFCMGVSMLLAVTVIVYIQDNVGWGWGFGIPTIAMAMSIVSFVGGYGMYRRLEPAGSPFTRLVQVMVAAYRKRKLPMVSDPSFLYENDEVDAAISLFGKLGHTKNFRFLDKAALVTEEESTEIQKQHQIPNPWKLSTVHRIEELKSLIRMSPVWSAGILVITASAQQGTFSLQQARTMDRHLFSTSFQIPPGSMSVFTMLAMLLTITLYDRILIPLTRRFTGLNRGISFLHRMAIGFFISVLATLIAGFIELKRKHVAAAHHLLDEPLTMVPISVFWLVPQYALHGVAEAFTSIGHLEFFYDQAPESMRSTATALFWLAISAGSYVSTLIVSMIHRFSARPDGSNWLPDNLNRGKLEYLYWIVTLLQFLNLLYYGVCVRFYTFKPLQLKVAVNEEDVGDVEKSDKVGGA
ncbi:Proton-dependent oligopeptide transporter family protein [Dioscorea alata]|uniref:Proton-dependent oligopeptide transporter family protein n=1 Tax=Dioscorea alata TaxID=55571 RepID=A0ACB7U6L6_DIOAL|nr:Proton-dependent oligopeptide transporter family protein [Dioscorea alata]